MEYGTQTDTVSSRGLPFDPAIPLLDAAKRWVWILLAAVLVSGGTFLCCRMTYTPVYEASATVVVAGKTGGNSSAGAAEVLAELFNSPLMHRTILEEAGIPEFDGAVSAAIVPETNLLELKVEAMEAQTAFSVIRALLDHHETVSAPVIGSMHLEILQTPELPDSPRNAPRTASLTLRVFALSALGMTVLCIWLSCLRDCIRSPQEARRKLNCPFLGCLPHIGKGKIYENCPDFAYSVRRLCRRIARRMGNGKILLVTSLLAHEGKTTVAVYLARTMAEKRRKVLLIDCDLYNPECASVLGQTADGPGLRDVLKGNASAARAVVPCGTTGLDLLPERSAGSGSGDRLSSAKMHRLLDWAREHYDFVVLDLPPMAPMSDAEGAADCADASILVIRQNGAGTADLNRAVAVLESGKAALLGCVLNDVHSSACYRRRTEGSRHG